MNVMTTTTYAAVRKNGLCRGTLWHQQGNSLSFSSSDKSCSYCALVGVRLDCYESLQTYQKGDPPSASFRAVGASAWNPPSGSGSTLFSSEILFRLMTNQGTHVHCQAPTAHCRDLWLAAFHAGLEQALNENTGSTLSPHAPQAALKRTRVNKYCNSCGVLEGGAKVIHSMVAPMLHYGKESRADLCNDCAIGQGLMDHIEFLKTILASSLQEHQAIEQARTLCANIMNVHKLPREGEHDDHSGSSESWLHVGSDSNSSSTPSPPDGNSTPLHNDSANNVAGNMAGSWQQVEGPPHLSWIHIPPTEKSTKTILEALQDPNQFGSFARLSPFLESIASELIGGKIGVADFLEQLFEGYGQSESYRISALKKQAVRLAGDMGSAMRILVENALPSREDKLADELACILEFLLDLCDEGELPSIAFFWPQLCHIHLRMLPPADSASVARVELMEDFLLTVATRYSIHLALELVWSHTADLEDSIYSPLTCAPSCRRRRFVVLRFMCELESLLFDFEGGWGGGSVSLGKMLAPTGNQVELMKQMMRQVQQLRRHMPVQLSRSARRDVLFLPKRDKPPEQAAHEKLRIAKNADYFSCHLNFSRRLADIAEKLWFLDASVRTEALQEELNLLNSSGAMGGDPLNRIREHLIRVVRVPSTEGHVFRSKERTPVLLLMEVVDEGAYVEAESEHDVDVSINTHQGLDACSNETCDVVDLTVHPASQSLGAVEIHDEALEESKHISNPGALKKFADSDHGPDLPPTPKRDVEKMVKSSMYLADDNFDLNLPDLKKNFGFQAVGSREDASTPDRDDRLLEGHETSKEQKAGKSKRTMSALGTVSMGVNDIGETKTYELAPTSDARREVLNAIMMIGIQGNAIAAGAALSVQRSLQELERKRATELLLRGEESADQAVRRTGSGEEIISARERLVALGLSIKDEDIVARPSEEDEVMEAIRLLLIQNRVAQGKLSPEDAAKVLQYVSISRVKESESLRAGELHSLDKSHPATVDAGDLDPRLVGCGPLPPAVLQALTLWKAGMVTNAELLELVKKDAEFMKHSVLIDSAKFDKLMEDSAFWGRFAFGERWAEKKARIASSSPQGSLPGWDLLGVIVKSNDDLRQEAFVMQLIELCQEAFDRASLELWVNPYRILATGRTSGVIEMVRNAMSFDALKKRPGYGKGGLREHLQRMTEYTADPGDAFKTAQYNFVRSLAAYSLMSYMFQFKDRHNGNILLDTAGHVLSIDYGFVFGIAPGGSFSLEMSTPFKLTEEMLEVMGGLKSPLFSEFVTLFCCGFLALRTHRDTFLTLVDITCRGSTFKCFDGRDPDEVLGQLNDRFCPDLCNEESVSFALDLIKQATTSYGTRQYDLFQYMSQGIAP